MGGLVTSVRPIGVVGLWHLGCTVAATWPELGVPVRAVDFDETCVAALAAGEPPVYEPGLADAIGRGLNAGSLTFSTDASTVRGCRFVFIAFDTPVANNDGSDLEPIASALRRVQPHLDADAVVIVSAQLPVGTAAVLRAELKREMPQVELVYSPENLRLGEALVCYRRPGHIVIGADDRAAGDLVEELFAPMDAACLRMGLASAEMAKHGINSFLATSIVFANQLADLCATSGADFADVARAMRHDPRIGARAYLSAGIGFSGGTLGRDLRVLDDLDRTRNGNRSPLFGDIWALNQQRVEVVRHRCEETLGPLHNRTVALLGLTYKPGTSTLRRSLPLQVAHDLTAHGARLRVYDPKADWEGVERPDALAVCDSAYDAAANADAVVILTEWPEFHGLDFDRLRRVMANPILFDTKDMLASRHCDLRRIGFRVLTLGRA